MRMDGSNARATSDVPSVEAPLTRITSTISGSRGVRGSTCGRLAASFSAGTTTDTRSMTLFPRRLEMTALPQHRSEGGPRPHELLKVAHEGLTLSGSEVLVQADQHPVAHDEAGGGQIAADAVGIMAHHGLFLDVPGHDGARFHLPAFKERRQFVARERSVGPHDQGIEEPGVAGAFPFGGAGKQTLHRPQPLPPLTR